MASDIVITPNRGSTTVNAKIDFTGASTASSQIRLEVLPDNSLSFVGTTGSLFSIADSVTGSLMSVNDASGLPILEVFDTDKVVMGQYNQNTLVVNSTNVGIGAASPASKLEIRGGTTNQTNDATVYITADNDNDWALVVDKNRSAASEYGLRIITGSAASYALAVYGSGSLSTRIAGNGDIYAPRMYDSTATAYYVDPGSTSNLNGLTVAGAITGTLSGNATTATTATNWGTYGAVPAAGTSFATANTIGRSDGNGYTFFGYINSNVANNENGTVSQFIITNGSDNYFRKASLSHVKSQMSLSASDNPQFNSIGLSIAASGTAGSISLNQSGTRSWSITPTGGNLAFASGDGNGALTYNNNIILHAGNYNSYAPTLTGTGASGTWGISITGNAATATSADQIDGVAFRNTGSNAGTAADSLEQNGITYVNSNISLLGQSDGALFSQAYNSNWQHQIYGDYRTGQIVVRGKNNGTWQSWRTVLDSSNYTSYTGHIGNGTLTLNTNSGSGLSGSASFTANQSGNVTFTVTSNATVNNTASTIMLRGSSNEVYIGDVFSSNWFRNVGSNGLYNSDHTMHWYAEAGYYNVAGGGSLTYGGIKFRAGHASTFKGSTYWDADGFGLLNQGGNWAVRINAASGYAGGSLYGVWDKRNASNTGTSVAIPGMFVQAGSTGAPSAIQNGDLWWNTETGKLKIWYSTSSAWVDATSVPDLANYFPVAGGNITGNVSIGGLLNTTGNITARNGQTHSLSMGQHPSYGTSWTGIWRTGSDYALITNNSDTLINAPTGTLGFRIGNSQYAYVNTSGLTAGVFNSTANSAALFANTSSTYGAWGISGSRNAYGGIYDSYSGVAWMHQSDGSGGLYKESNSRWYIYHNTANNCTGIGGSATASGYGLYVNGNSYVSGYERVGGGNLYIDGNYGRGVVGAYSSTRYQGVFAMGDSYKLADDGTTTGSLYGIAWSHPNAGGVAANLNTHGALVMENGTFLAAISGSIRSRDDMRAPVFYDSNDTGFYCDPNGYSNLKNITNVYYAKNGVYNNLGNPSVDEKALFHGQFNNKFRFWAPQTQEQSTNGTTWTTSTRATSQQLLDIMIGEGQGSGFTAIPAPGTGNAGYYRLTWDATIAGSPAYCFLDAVYCYNSTNGNNVTFTVEAQDSGTSNWVTIATGTISNWPGHTYIPHSSLPYVANSTAGYYKKVRLTFAITSAAAYGTGFDLYAVEWWGGYPQGRRNVESFDSNRNVFWPAKVYGTQFVDQNNSSYYLDPDSTSVLNGLTIGGNTAIHAGNYTSYVGNGTLTLNVSGTGLSGSTSFTANQSGNTTFTVTSNATSANTASAIVARDSNGDFQARNITTQDDYTNGWFRNNSNNTGLYNQSTYLHLSSTGANTSYLDISTVGSTNSGIRFYTGGHVNTLRGYIVANTSNELMLWNAGGSYSARFTSTQSEIYQDTYVPTLYANIMYRRGDTGYYLDPAATESGKMKYSFTVSGAGSSAGYGLALYPSYTNSNGSGTEPTYGVMFASTSTYSGHGAVASGDWATYFTMSNSDARGWIFRKTGSGNVASISGSGRMRVQSLGVNTDPSATAGEIRATDNITAYYSDERLKTKLGAIENPIEKVKSLSGFYFEANETAVALGYQKKREVGVSAQEVQAILPEIIAPAPIDDKYMTVRYEKLIPLLIEAIKAQQAQIEELQKLIKEKV